MIAISGVVEASTVRRAAAVQFAGLRLLGLALTILAAVRLGITGTASLASVVLLTAGVLLVALPSVLGASAARRFRAPIAAFASETGFRPTAESPEIPWTQFHQAKVLSDCVILYRSSIPLAVISRALLATPSEWEQLLCWVTRSVPRGHRSATLPGFK
jgi:hypothetical protein